MRIIMAYTSKKLGQSVKNIEAVTLRCTTSAPTISSSILLFWWGICLHSKPLSLKPLQILVIMDYTHTATADPYSLTLLPQTCHPFFLIVPVPANPYNFGIIPSAKEQNMPEHS